MFTLVILLAFQIVLAHAGDAEEINLGKALVEEKVSCSELSDIQLEAIGEYVMELMHPGEAHDLMDNLMGGEGSPQLTLVHIQMARQVYCNETTSSAGMMRYGYMMGQSGMMNMMFGTWSRTGLINWDGYGKSMFGFAWFGMILIWLFGIALIVLAVLLIIKMWKSLEPRKRR